MLGFRDSLTLATTKLRTRRIRLIVTLIVSGLLFTVLVLASLIIRGTIHSLESFTKEGLLNRFIVTTFQPSDYNFTQSATFIAHVETLQKQRSEAQAKEAKRLGISFDPQTAPKAVIENTGPDGKKIKGVDMEAAIARQAYLELKPDTTKAYLENLAKPYQPIGFHQQMSLSSYLIGKHSLVPIVHNEEVTTNDPNAGRGPGVQDAFKSFSQSLSAADNTLIQPFVLPGATLSVGTDQRIPILMPVDAAEKLLDLAPLSNKATPKQRLERLRDLRVKAKDLTVEVCYRNGTAGALRDTAKQQATEIAAGTKTPGYQKPELIYNAPTSACVPVTIKSDARSGEAKTLAAKEAEFGRAFDAPDPITQRLSFRVVGLLPQIGSLFSANGPEALISAFFTSSLGEGWFMSREAALANPTLKTLVADPYMATNGGRSFLVEFANRTNQKHFIDDKNCDPGRSSDPLECQKQGKIFASAFGNPLATIYQLKDGFNTGLRWALIIIAVLSAIIMMGTIGKIIADSRKETSVFRAVGAKRLDIAQIYLLYTAILGSLSFLVALGLGLAIAALLEAAYSPELSSQAVLAFNSQNLDKTFHLINLNPLDLGGIFVFVLAISLASGIIPLLGNLRRNPVKDMREE